MKVIDISRTFQDAPVYPGGVQAKIEPISSTAKGDICNVSLITADSHTGTHADACSHYFADSDQTIDKMPLENYCGKCVVLSVPGDGYIKLEDIRGRLNGYDRIVLHTGGSGYLCQQVADYLVACRVKAVVTDAPSVGAADNEQDIHTTLLGAGVAVVENAVLDGVKDGEYLLFAFPVKYGGCDGAPVRAVLISGEEE